MTENKDNTDNNEKPTEEKQRFSSKGKHRILKEMGVAVLLFVALGIWMYICMTPSREHVDAAKAHIEAYSRYAILEDGKEVLSFDQDTVTLAANFMDSFTLLPSCRGKLAAAYNATLSENKYLGMQADSIFKEKIDSLDSLYKDSHWKTSELNYYIHSHSPQDLGYNRICAYASQETQLSKSSKKLLDSLHHVKKQGDSLRQANKNIHQANKNSHHAQNGKGQLQLVHRVTYRAFYRNEAGKMVSEPCELLGDMKGQGTSGAKRFQLVSKTTPAGVRPIYPQLAASLAIAHGSTLHRYIDFDVRIDSMGYYKGTVDSLKRPDGHGTWQGLDGDHYEGGWKNGKREGWGFSISSNKPLRVGEWKGDRYKGERLVYSSERIYGIDISKYQHEEDKVVKQKKVVRIRRRRKVVTVTKVIKHRYSIDWNRLRITHLGSISRKTVSGDVDFPIRFIYIKSTEGASLLNPYYKKDYSDARAHGYHVGTYHFFSTRTPAGQQADFFLRHSHVRKGDFPPVLDVEPLPSQIAAMGGTGVLFARVRTWLRLVERATGVKPILYVSQTFVNRYLSRAPDLKRDYQVWIARYGEYKPDIHLVYWQLCPDGRVSGIHGHVDINVFNGYKDAFDKFSKNDAAR